MDRVQKLLSSFGYCSRRKAEDLIAQGRVQVNGKTISLGDKASDDDKITVDGSEIKQQKKIYLMFHKPVGCVTALWDRRYRTIMDYVDIKQRIFPVGRLDYNTSGLLILTNDGDFANSIMHPRYEIKKTYLVGTDKPVSGSHIEMIRKGVKLQDGVTTEAQVSQPEPRLLEIQIHEGRNRIIRRIMKKLGYKIAFIKRTKIGRLELGDLGEGKYAALTEKQKSLVKL